MNKLELTDEEIIIFRAALKDVYDAGSRDGTFNANGLHDLSEGPSNALHNAVEKFCEKT